MRKFRNLVIALAVALTGFAPARSWSANPADPGKGPPDCPGTPGAFLSGEAQELVAQGTPPGEIVSDGAKGQGVGETVRSALRDACGIGALPPPEDGSG